MSSVARVTPMGESLYNENDPYPAQWLRNLIAAGHLPDGRVDERSIVELEPKDCQETSHFFAGVGGWPLALRLAGWGDRPVWTGSCPCQPFSVAGKRGAANDPRHLWPEWFRLIRECRPGIVFGEQVASRDGYAWLDLVHADLESSGYTVGAVVAPAAGFGAPHLRHRIYFVAHTSRATGERNPRGVLGAQAQVGGKDGPEHGHRLERLADGSPTGLLADPPGWIASDEELQRGGEHGQRQEDGGVGLVDDPEDSDGRSAASGPSPQIGGPGPTNGFWADAEWLPCSDGKARPTQPLIFPLASGVPGRVGRLRAYGNAICVPQAVEFIRAFMNA